jgi:hypothetical protein
MLSTEKISTTLEQRKMDFVPKSPVFMILTEKHCKFQEMRAFTRMIGKRVFLIVLFTFIVMRILYIYFHKYLEFKYLHITNDPSILKKNAITPAKSGSNSIQNSLRNISKAKIDWKDDKTLRSGDLPLRKSFKGQPGGTAVDRLNLTNILSLNTTSSRKRSSRLTKKPFYEDWENALVPSEMSWESFVTIPRQAPRSKQSIPSTAVSHLRTCSDSMGIRNYTVNATRKGCMEVKKFILMICSVFLLLSFLIYRYGMMNLFNLGKTEK